MKEITIPASVEIADVAKYDYAAFYGCTNIEKVTLTKGTGTMKISSTRSNYPWYDSIAKLKEVVIEEGVINIIDYAFYDCTALTAVSLPESLTSIGNHAFNSCTSLTEITLYEGLKTIGHSAFSGCTNLVTVGGIPSTVTSIGSSCFYKCSALTDAIVIPSGMTTIEGSIFRGCQKIPGVVIPASITTIGAYAFRDCSSLKEITIPDSVSKLENYTFYNCTGLKEITIPASVEIADNSASSTAAFYGCTNIEKVTLTKGTGTMKISSDTSYYPWDKSREKLKEVVIEDGVTNIIASAFYGCTALTSVALPGSLTSIGNNAFYNCTSLAEITIPNKNCSVYDSSSTFNAKTVIKAPCGSLAQNYAKKYSRTFVITEHTYTDWLADFSVARSAMTTEIYHKCVHCDGIFDSSTHSTNGWIIDSDATCILEGSKHIECIDCGNIYTSSIPATGHTEVIDNAVSPTCTQSGLTEGKHCSVCGDVLVAQSVVDALGHDVVIVDSVNPTCTESGLTEGRYCALCGEVFVVQTEDPALGHAWVDVTYSYKECSRCEETLGDLNVIHGDVNGDGSVDSNDAIHLLYYTLLPDRYAVNQECDFDNDSDVNSNDAIYLLYHTLLPDRYPLVWKKDDEIEI